MAAEWLTGIWQKMNKPVHYLVVGAALVIFSPDEYEWTGYIVGAFGAAGFIEWIGKQFHVLIKMQAERQKVLSDLQSLNTEEKEILRELVSQNQQTMYINWHDYHGMGRRAGSSRIYVQKFGVCAGLAKKVIMTANTVGDITSFTVQSFAWRILQQEYKKNPAFLNDNRRTDRQEAA